MAGLLAWAADVVGGGAQGGEEEEETSFSAVVFTPEQQKYARELEQRASSLRRSIQDLRLRIPPPDISQRLPHLHAHSLASNAALALQLNSHSTTRQQVQLREVSLQEENAAYEKAVSNCQKKIQDKLQEMDLLQHKLKEMDLTEKSLRAELEITEASSDASQSTNFGDDSKIAKEALADRELPKHAILEDLDNKKRELSSVEAMVQNLENTWAQIQLKSAKEPSPAQREKILEKQLQSLIEQLESKQVQAEHLVTEIHVKERELEKLNDLWRIENGNMEVNAARNRFGRSSSSLGSTSTDYFIDSQIRPSTGGRIENQQKMMLMRSAFVLYILALHVLVFIKISF
ncbi:putative leucine-rich repeat-containing protein [Cinnamomum micranthum f. kanehirae]|uniref:Putative leucine-rich repeat-containing protein n=1 Tax=Cinnamomum micranthum f. kanehirae TaxID=337451 RepID=A0A443NEZ3_9MAGN|nr:putative leucine-rich repeat-containing protein [Cinnamomum micranthum f. kanehirae]